MIRALLQRTWKATPRESWQAWHCRNATKKFIYSLEVSKIATRHLQPVPDMGIQEKHSRHRNRPSRSEEHGRHSGEQLPVRHAGQTHLSGVSLGVANDRGWCCWRSCLLYCSSSARRMLSVGVEAAESVAASGTDGLPSGTCTVQMTLKQKSF